MKFIHYYPRALVGNGGPTVAMWSWVHALKEAGQDVKVICDSTLIAKQPLAVPGINVIPLKHRLFGRWRYPEGIEQHLTADTILIVHSAYLANNLIAAIKSKKSGSKTIFVPHGAYEHDARQRNALIKRTWLGFEKRIVDSSLAVHAFVDTEIRSIKEVAPNVPILVAPTPVAIPESHTWTGGGGYIAWMGRYDIEHKGLDLLIEAYQMVPPEIRLPLRLRGRNSTNTRAEVVDLVAKAGLSSFISIGGPIDGEEKIDFLKSAEFFVMPSRWESFSIALIEVLALNVPCLISSNMPISAKLGTEQASMISSIDPVELAKNLEHFLRNRSDIISSLFPRDFVARNLTYKSVGNCFVNQVASLVGL